MFRKSQKQTERQMLDIVNSRANGNKCGECGAEYPTWASWNLGILLCGRCANCHRKVLAVAGPRGDPISKVKSLALENWSEDQLEYLRRIGNKKAKNRWNPKQVPFPYDDDDDRPIEEFLRDKYILGRFRDDNIDADDYGGKNSRYSDDSGRSTPQGRSRSSSHIVNSRRDASRSLPRLSHRKPTSSELSQFRNSANKIVGYGFSDRDAVVESLALANGDIELALDILDHDAKVNPSSAEVPPDLPKRPVASHAGNTGADTTAATTATTPATSAGSEWWAGQAPQTTGVVSGQATGFVPGQTAQPQIYQYTDPVTGQVSYVDANGQQYLDPSNPQHQQLLSQQTNPQFLAQQATKQNIMSLYSQPEQYSTNVAVPSTQPTGQGLGSGQNQGQNQGLGQFQTQTGQFQSQPQIQQQFTQQFTQQPQFTGAGFGGQAYGQYAPQQQMQTGAQQLSQQQLSQQQLSQQQLSQQYAQQQQFWR